MWTVNEEQWMEWSIRKGVDGVITDDPKLFLEVCQRWEEKSEVEGEDRDGLEDVPVEDDAQVWAGHVPSTAGYGPYGVLVSTPGHARRRKQVPIPSA